MLYVRAAFVCVMLCLASFQAMALTSPWFQNWTNPQVKVRLLASGDTLENKAFVAGLEVQLNGGWKTYWRTPGIAGVAPSVDWSGSSNLQKVIWSWPMPKHYQVSGIDTLGYKGQVVFPLKIIPKDPSKPVQLVGKATVPACQNECVILNYRINATLDGKNLDYDTIADTLIHQYQAQVPEKKASSFLQIQSLFWNKETQLLTLSASSKKTWDNPQIIIESKPNLEFGKPIITLLNKHQLQANFPVKIYGDKAEQFFNQPFTAIVGNSQIALEKNVSVQVKPIAQTSHYDWLWILGASLLGGLILNLMPCVLPVISIKIFSILSSSKLAKSSIRKNFIASALGILTSMWGLALFLLFLKLSGQSIGWGIQFQSPIFLGFMALVMTVFSANLLGLFEVQLPGGLNNRLAQAGDNSTLGHFLQGVVATLLATPCSAPFLATAIGFALSMGNFAIFAIFTMIGLGLALPFIAIALIPSSIKLLPKPGPWMLKCKYFLGLLLLITLGWILYLFAQHLSLATQTAVLTMILCFFGFLLNKAKKFLFHFSAQGVVIIAVSLAISFVTVQLAKPLVQHSEIQTNLSWQPLDPSLINQKVSEGKVVFVDITANWCITCFANKVNVLSQDPVYSLLKNKSKVVTMQGDWSRPSALVDKFLADHKRYAVPFNIVYGKGAPEGIILPSLLTTESVVSAIKQAQSVQK